MLSKYAQNLCNYLDFDVSDKSGDRKSMRKVTKALKEFTKYHNVEGKGEGDGGSHGIPLHRLTSPFARRARRDP